MTRADLEIDADRVDQLTCPSCGTAFAVDAFPPLSTVGCPDCEAEQVVPARLGSFLLLKTLGRGGMGAVYKALDETLNRHVAVKVLRKEYGEDETFLADFLKEAQAAAALNHRNVAAIYSYGQEKGQPYIVMELLEAGRLDAMIEKGQLLDEVFVMEVAEHVAEGLEAAHEIGLRHGDIKPANILFNERGVAKVVDFGLASFAGSHHAKPGEIWGTPYYIPPETVKGKVGDHRGDIYSLGGTIFHALAGTAPFEGETAKEVVKARLDKPAPSIKSYREDVTNETEAVIRRMLSRSTSRRYPTYTSLLSDLRKATRAARRAAAQRRRIAEQKAATAALAARRRPVKIGLLVATLLMALAYGAWWWVDTHREPERKIVGHILQGGVLIPVYEDEVTAEDGEGEDAGTPDREDPSRAEREKIVSRLRDEAATLAEGPSLAAMERLASTVRELEPSNPLRAEAAMLQVLGSWVHGQRRDADPVVAALQASLAEEGAGVPEGYDRIVGFLSGEHGRDELEAARDGWEAEPTRALADLVAGLDAAFRGEAPAARKFLDAYEQRAGEDWVLAFRPRAPAWRKALDEWEEAEKQAGAAPPNQGIQRLQQLLESGGGILRPVIEARIATLERKRDQEIKARQAANRAKLQQQEARDEARATDARAEIRTLLAERNFAEAADVVVRTLKQMETPAGRNTLAEDRRNIDRLLAIRPFLVTSVNASPPKGPISEIGGRIARADADQVYLSTIEGGGGTAWDALSPGLYFKLLGYYIENADAPAAERARIALGVAYYCDVVPRMPASARDGFARKAVELDPSLANEASALLKGFDLSEPPAK